MNIKLSTVELRLWVTLSRLFLVMSFTPTGAGKVANWPFSVVSRSDKLIPKPLHVFQTQSLKLLRDLSVLIGY